MMAINLKQASLTFSIAKIGIRVNCVRHELIGSLAQHYQEFAAGKDIQMEVILRVNDWGGEIELLEQPLFFENDRVIINAPGLEGFIDCERGLAEISIPVRRSVENTEYFLRLVTAFQVFREGGLLFHAAGIVKDGYAYLFFGQSGAGKTTVASHSLGYVILNDDLLVLSIDKGIWRAHATPFSNPTQLKPTNQNALVKAMYRLVQDDRVYLESMSPGYSLAEVLASVPVIPKAPHWRDNLILRCQALIGAQPVHKLHFLPDGSFWNVIEASQSQP